MKNATRLDGSSDFNAVFTRTMHILIFVYARPARQSESARHQNRLSARHYRHLLKAFGFPLVNRFRRMLCTMPSTS